MNRLEAEVLAKLDEGAAKVLRTTLASWPTLDPLPELVQADPQPFPFEALGPILGPAASLIAETVQAPCALAGGGVLAAAAVAAQPHANVVMPHGQELPLSLFVAGAAGSGDRKSAVDSITCWPIDEQRKRDARATAKARAEFKAEKAKRKPGDPQDEPPADKALTVAKATTEGLHHLLRNQSHIGLFSTEGAELVSGHSMRDEKRSAGIAWLLKAWGGETVDSMTRGDGLSVLVGRRVSMHVLMQPVILQTMMADPLAQGQGWIARTLIAAPKSLAGTRMFRAHRGHASKLPDVQRYYAALGELLRIVPLTHPDGDGYELTPRALQLTDEAAALWIEFYNAVELEQRPGGALAGVTAWASKAAEHAGRIAGVITLVGNPHATAIDQEAMLGAIGVVNFYLGEHVRLMGQTVNTQRLKLLHDLLAWLTDRGQRVKRVDVLRFSPRHLRDLKADGLNPLLTELSERGYIRLAGDSWEVRGA